MEQDNKPAPPSGLFNVPEDSLKPDAPTEVYLEQYKTYLECLDKLSDRRQTANTFFLTLNTGLCAVLGFIFSKDTDPDIKHFSVIIPVAGILISYFWQRLVKSYRQLNTGKFAILHKMEQYLPMAPYRAEWDVLGHGTDSKKYVPLTHIEVWVPRMFILIYLLLIGCWIPWTRLWAVFH